MKALSWGKKRCRDGRGGLYDLLYFIAFFQKTIDSNFWIGQSNFLKAEKGDHSLNKLTGKETNNKFSFACPRPQGRQKKDANKKKSLQKFFFFYFSLKKSAIFRWVFFLYVAKIELKGVPK